MIHILSFDDFESFFSPTILERGKSYYRKGHVVDLDETKSHSWKAKVAGTEIYKVKIESSEDGFYSCSCTCPFAETSPCKHMAAICYAIKDDSPVIGDIKDPQTRNKAQNSASPQKKETLSEQVDKLLKSCSAKELADFVKELTEYDRNIRNRFLARFTPAGSPESQSGYRKMIKNALSPARRKGLVYASEAASILAPVNDLLQKAENQIDQHPETSIAIAQTVIEELVPAFQFIDDSYGNVGDTLYWAFELLRQLSNRDLPVQLKSQLLKWCLRSFTKQKYEGWNYQWDIMEIAINLAEDDTDFDDITALLDEIINKKTAGDNDYSTQWKLQRAVLLKVDLLARYASDEELNKLLEAHRDLPDVRKRMLERAWTLEDLDAVKELAQEALEKFRHSHPGLNSNWHHWLLKVAQKQDDKEEIKRLQLQLLLEKGEMEHYRTLKALYDEEEWKSILPEIQQEIRSVGRYHFMPEIYVEEQQWEKLLEYLQKFPDLPTLKYYDEHLKERYPDELFELYSEEIRDYLKQTGRKYYQEACRYMVHLYGLGGTNQVLDLIQELRDKYANRPALQDELNKLETRLGLN